MKRYRKYTLSLLCVLCASQTLLAWDDIYDYENEGEDFLEETVDHYRYEPLRISHTEAKGIGYKEGYTTLEAFLTYPNLVHHHWVPFLDLRSHVFNDGKYDSNAGLGLRYLDARVWGLNVFYDYRSTHHANYNQVGVGIESLGCEWDFRLNSYFPMGRKKSHLFAMKGLDAEVGTTVTNFNDLSIYTATGPYYFENEGKHAVGGKARASVRCLECLLLELSGSYDHIFKGIVQGKVSLNIPIGPLNSIRGDRPCYNVDTLTLRKKTMQRVERQEIIVIDSKTNKSPAIAPLTDNP